MSLQILLVIIKCFVGKICRCPSLPLLGNATVKMSRGLAHAQNGITWLRAALRLLLYAADVCTLRRSRPYRKGSTAVRVSYLVNLQRGVNLDMLSFCLFVIEVMHDASGWTGRIDQFHYWVLFISHAKKLLIIKCFVDENGCCPSRF